LLESDAEKAERALAQTWNRRKIADLVGWRGYKRSQSCVRHVSNYWTIGLYVGDVWSLIGHSEEMLKRENPVRFVNDGSFNWSPRCCVPNASRVRGRVNLQTCLLSCEVCDAGSVVYCENLNQARSVLAKTAPERNKVRVCTNRVENATEITDCGSSIYFESCCLMLNINV
jgi:hypothetical protein